jgi:hypothetical protein
MAMGLLGSGLACASAPLVGLDQLPRADRQMFQRCREPLAGELCRGHDGEGRARCLDAQSAVFAGRRTTKMRRSWLALNGCPHALIDAADEAPIEAVVSAPASIPATPPPIQASVLLGVASPCRRSADCASDLCVRGSCVTVASFDPEDSCAAARPSTRSPNGERSAARAVIPVPPAGPRVSSAGAAVQLRETIVGHEAEMKMCVERQLKLLPTLRAEGTLVLEVDGSGRVVRAGLTGAQLAGTALEDCLRAVASRWRFPRTASAYAVEAPLTVSGVMP